MQFSGELVIAATVEGVSRLTVGPVRRRTKHIAQKYTVCFVFFLCFRVPLRLGYK